MLDENVIMALIKGFKVVQSMLTMMNMNGPSCGMRLGFMVQ
jgi:hypothetical protein